MKLNITNLSNKNPFPSAENTCFGHNIISIECFDSLLVEIQNKTSGDMVNYFTNEWSWSATHLRGNHTAEQDPSFNSSVIILPREILLKPRQLVDAFDLNIYAILLPIYKETNQFFIKSENFRHRTNSFMG